MTTSLLRSWPSVLVIALMASSCAVPTTPTPVMPSPEKAVEIRGTVMVWLDCEECSDGELSAVVKLGEAAVPSLTASLRDGLSSARREQLRRHLEESYTRLPDRSRASVDVYVQRYTDNMVALHQVRAATALSIIGGPAARRALEDAQAGPTETTSNRASRPRWRGLGNPDRRAGRQGVNTWDTTVSPVQVRTKAPRSPSRSAAITQNEFKELKNKLKDCMNELAKMKAGESLTWKRVAIRKYS